MTITSIYAHIRIFALIEIKKPSPYLSHCHPGSPISKIASKRLLVSLAAFNRYAIPLFKQRLAFAAL